MEYRHPRRPTGAVPTEYQDGSRRRDDVDDTGAQQRRNTGQAVVEPDDHWWRCWGNKDGPGAQFRIEVMAKLDALTKRSWYQAGGAAVVGLIALAFLASWLSGKFAATERSAVKREDVVAAVQKGADMSAAKYGDDLMNLKKQIEQAAADTSAPPMPTYTKARK